MEHEKGLCLNCLESKDDCECGGEVEITNTIEEEAIEKEKEVLSNLLELIYNDSYKDFYNFAVFLNTHRHAVERLLKLMENE